MSDVDGNTYRAVRIGTQTWTVENLRTTKFSDGTAIPHVTDSLAWHGLSSPGYCYYGNTTDGDTIRKFGALYNWYAVDTRKLAPPGWHVATEQDWDTLKEYLIAQGYNWDGARSGNRIAMALAAQDGWLPFEIEGCPGNDMRANNRSGFTGYATGYRFDSHDSLQGSERWRGAFQAIGHKAGWWSATPVNETIACSYGLGFCVDAFLKYRSFYKTCGYSVRLVKDPTQTRSSP